MKETNITIDKAYFDRLCADYKSSPWDKDSMGIGTYGEKSLHKIIKAYFGGNDDVYEVPVGKYVADILKDGHIIEVQTRRFSYLLPKLRYYLENTDCDISVVYPIISKKRILRIDKESGEILRQRRLSHYQSIYDFGAELYYLRELLPNPRISLKVFFISAEEHRFSERVKYRKSGAYESVLYPTELIRADSFDELSDFLCLMPDTDGFTAKDYAAYIKKRGRVPSLCLSFLCGIGLLYRKKEGNKYIYFHT